MATVEKVAILYEKPSEPSAGDFDMVKFAKFLNGLRKTVSCKLYTIDEFCDEKTATTASPKKWNKAVLFIMDADNMVQTVEKVRKKFDVENFVEMKIVLTAPKKTWLTDNIIRCESLEEVADWYPEVLVFLFERPRALRRDRLAVFMIDHEMDIEMNWYEKIRKICGKYDKSCIWTGAAFDNKFKLTEQTVDTVVVVSRGKGDEVLPKHDNDKLLKEMASMKKIKFLVFTDNTRGKAVRAANKYRDLVRKPEPTIYKCKDTLELDYIKWTSLMQKMSIVDCRDVFEPSIVKKIFMVIGIVLYVLFIVIPFFFIWFFLAICCEIVVIPGCVPKPFANKIRPNKK